MKTKNYLKKFAQFFVLVILVIGGFLAHNIEKGNFAIIPSNQNVVENTSHFSYSNKLSSLISISNFTKVAEAANGQCNIAYGTCISGTVNGWSSSGGNATWQCVGTNYGTTANCSINVCNGMPLNGCNVGSTRDKTDGACTNDWECGTFYGGSYISCSTAKAATNGQCSTTLNTCTKGSLSDDADTTAEYKWSCTGLCSGTTAYCTKAKATCTLPWGGSIASGASVTAYASQSSSCGTYGNLSETRTCNNGTLSGSYTLQTGATLTTRTGVYGSSVACGTACTSQTQTCKSDGTWSGSGSLSCVPSSRRMYTAQTSSCGTYGSAYEDQSCQSSGSWSGTYTLASAPSASTRTMYAAQTSSCGTYGSASETQTCQSTGWNGSYTLSSAPSATSRTGKLAGASSCGTYSCSNQTQYCQSNGSWGGSGTDSCAVDTRTMYAAQTSACGTYGSTSETQTCQSTGWNGSYTLSSAPSSTSRTGVKGSVVSCGSACVSETQYCQSNGLWGGSGSLSCVPSSRRMYTAQTSSCGTYGSAYEDQSCQSSGSWSGSYTLTSAPSTTSRTGKLAASSACGVYSCSDQTQYCQSTGLWGGSGTDSCTVNSRQGYTASSVACGSSCTQQLQYCQSGGGWGGTGIGSCSATPVNGTCNSSVINGCSSGILNADSPADTASAYNWTCGGDCGGSSESCSFVKPPVVVVSMATANGGSSGSAYAGEAAALNWTASNSPTGCSIYRNGSLLTTVGGSVVTYTTAALPAGNTTYRVDCTNAGGTGTGNTVTFKVPLAPTGLSVTCPAPGTTANFTWTLPSGLTSTYFRSHTSPPAYADYTAACVPAKTPPNGSCMTVSGSSLSQATTPNTSYIWYIHASDAYGNWGPAEGSAFYCAPPAPNTPTITGPTSGTVGNSYNFNFTATDSAGMQVKYAIDSNNDSVAETTTALGASGFTYTWSNGWGGSGTKYFKVKTIASDSRESAWVTYTFNVLNLPTASITPASTEVNYNTAGAVSWSSTGAVGGCNVTKAGGAWQSGTSGTSVTTGALTADTTFDIYCSNGVDTSHVATTIYVKPGITINASPTTTSYNTASTISWSTSYASSCNITKAGSAWMTGTSHAGATSLNLLATTIFGITCSSASGHNQTSSVTVTVSALNGACNNTVIDGCTSGILTQTPADDADYYYWTCEGRNSGTNSLTCSFPKPKDGVCGAPDNSCIAGTLSDTPDITTYKLWDCGGLYGGATSTCKSPETPIITGPTSCGTYKDYEYSFTLNNPTGGLLSYYMDWDNDGVADQSGGTFPSGTKIDLTKQWTTPGDKYFKVKTGSSGGGESLWSTIYAVTCHDRPTISLDAMPTTVEYNSSTKITWSSNDADTCTVKKDGLAWKTGTSGTDVDTGLLTERTVFTLSCENIGGTNVTSIYVNVKPSITITASPNQVDYNTATNISWISHNASSCWVTEAGLNPRTGTSNPGISSNNLTSTTDFVATCISPENETKTATATVAVNSLNGACNNSVIDGCLSGVLTQTPEDDENLNYWTCEGRNGGTNSPTCFYAKTINGVCGAPNNECEKGSYSDAADTSANYGWSCIGLNGGATANCKSPETPIITGPTSCAINTEYNYVFQSNDIEGKNYSYNIDWDNDGTADQSVGTFEVGATYTGKNQWSGTGVKNFKARVTSVDGRISPWSTAYSVTCYDKPVISITVASPVVYYNSSTTVTWTSPDDTDSCSVTKNGAAWQTGKSGTNVSTGNLIQDKVTFTLSCTNIAGTSTTSVDVLVKPNVTISATPNPIDYASSTNITWTSEGAANCSVTRAGEYWESGDFGTSISSGPLYANTTFIVTCESYYLQTDSDEVDVIVGSLNGGCNNSVIDGCTSGILTQTPADDASFNYWTCKGANGGTDSPTCFYAKAVNGVCGAPNNSCSKGSFSEVADTATNVLWDCFDTNGGTTANCKSPNAPTITGSNSCLVGVSQNFNISASDYLSQAVQYDIDWDNNDTPDTTTVLGASAWTHVASNNWGGAGSKAFKSRTISSDGRISPWSAFSLTCRSSVTFDGNTNTGGSMSPQLFDLNETKSLSSNGFTKTWNTFIGWATSAGGAVVYTNGANYTGGSTSTILYAKWTPITHTVTFDGNTKTGGAIAPQTFNEGESKNLTSNGFTKTGNVFAGWASSPSGAVAYADGASYTMGTSNVTLYAKWTPITHTVTFDGNTNTGGTTAPQTFNEGEPKNLTSNGFTKTGYSFMGWATTAVGIPMYTDGASYTIGTSNVTLYAIWEQNPLCGAPNNSCARGNFSETADTALNVNWSCVSIYGGPTANCKSPNAPTITGPTTGAIGTNYNFSFQASDALANVRYDIDWDNDGIVNASSTFGSSNWIYTTGNNWGGSGPKYFKARTVATDGRTSPWSETFVITIVGAPVISITSALNTVDFYNGTTISWTSTGATSCTIKKGATVGWKTGLNGTNISTGSLVEYTAFDLSCTGDGGTSVASIIIYVRPEIDVIATPSVVGYGASSIISWETNNASSCDSGGLGVDDISNIDGVATENLTSSQTYTISCIAPGGATATKDVTVSVGSLDGDCGVTPTHFLCDSGNPTNNQGAGIGVSKWTWTCSGMNGGASPNCSEDKPLPLPPVITGTTTGKASTSYTFGFQATNPSGEPIIYAIDWNPATTTDPIQYLPATGTTTSGTLLTANNNWGGSGTKTFRARTETGGGPVSTWTTHTITIYGAPTITWMPTSATIPYGSRLSFGYTATDAVYCNLFATIPGDISTYETNPYWAGASSTNSWTSVGPYEQSFKRKAVCYNPYGEYTSAEMSITVLQNGASCGVVNIPNYLTPGQVFNASSTMINTNQNIWTNGSPLKHRVYSTSTIWGAQYMNLTNGPIGNGGTGLFTGSFTAPTATGTYAFDWRAIEEGEYSTSTILFGPICNPTTPNEGKIVVSHPVLGVGPTDIDITDYSMPGAYVTGDPASTGTIRIINRGGGKLIGTVNVTGTGYSCFSGCSFDLAGGESSNVEIQFQSLTATGTFPGLMNVTSGSQVRIVNISETTGDKFTVITSPLDFGHVAVGRSKYLNISIVNNSTSQTSGSFAITPTGPFHCESGCASASIPPGGTRVIKIRFTPTVINDLPISQDVILTTTPSMTIKLLGQGIKPTFKVEER